MSYSFPTPDEIRRMVASRPPIAVGLAHEGWSYSDFHAEPDHHPDCLPAWAFYSLRRLPGAVPCGHDGVAFPVQGGDGAPRAALLALHAALSAGEPDAVRDDMVMAETSRDPFGLIRRLRDARREMASLPAAGLAGITPDANRRGKAACLRLAISLGRCMLHGASAPADLMTTLTADEAGRACQEADRITCTAYVLAAVSLPADVEGSVDPSEADNYCERLLEWRTDVMAVQEAVGDVDALGGWAWAYWILDGSASAYDAVLCETTRLALLARAADWLHDARASLAPRYRDHLPWWLDAEFEAAGRAP